ncbi:Eisosome component PIL1-domain-containing protein [Aspergillus varians]
MNRTLSGRRRSSGTNTGRHRFSIGSFRGHQQPQLSKKMNRVIKSENSAISAHESAARQRISIAAQVSDWGESTEDDAISDISDKLGVLLAEMGEEEDSYAQNLEEYRTVLKHIRDTESSVQPTRDQRSKISDDIQRLKLKEPNSHKIDTLEQELVRAEAQNLVAEAQLTNVTRQRFKEAYSVHLAAVIERGEKQVLLARHARRLLNCLDDTSVVPGDEPKVYAHGDEAKQIIEDAERELRSWERNLEPVQIESSGAAALPVPASIPSSAREFREVPTAEPEGVESQAPEDLEREPHYSQAESQGGEALAEDASVSDEYSHVSPTDVAPRARVHSMSAPMMEAAALEARTSATPKPQLESGNPGTQVNGPSGLNRLDEGHKTLGTEPTRRLNESVSDTDFTFLPKQAEQTHLGTSLDTQVQRVVAVPI